MVLERLLIRVLRRRGKKIAMDVARGIDKMHSRQFVHLDLKSPNILLSASGTAKIAVGLSAHWAHLSMRAHSLHQPWH